MNLRGKQINYHRLRYSKNYLIGKSLQYFNKSATFILHPTVCSYIVVKQHQSNQQQVQFSMIWTKTIHIGMMNAISEEVDGLDAVLAEIASLEHTPTSVLQVGETSSNYACLMNNSEFEVNLVENEQKDILVAPAIDTDAIYHDYK
jgi:hypothetical protein